MNQIIKDGKLPSITNDGPNSVHPTLSKEKRGGYYNGGTADKYRLGAAYFSYKGFRFGRNSEAIRHAIQNKFAHTTASYQPWYKVLDIQPQGYFQYQPANPYTLW